MNKFFIVLINLCSSYHICRNIILKLVETLFVKGLLGSFFSFDLFLHLIVRFNLDFKFSSAFELT